MQARPLGRYLEEFTIGEEMTTPACTMTEADIVLFAGLSGDYNLLHIDEEFAKGTPFGRHIVEAAVSKLAEALREYHGRE